MKGNYLLIFFIFTYAFAKAQSDCAALISPVDGQTNVLVESVISWEPETDVFGYSISLGTTEGGIDIANNVSVGATPAFTPPLGLPESTLIFVTITILIDQTTSFVCDSQSFTTTDVTTVPGCTQLSSPPDGATDIPVNTVLQWFYAPRATGYLVNLGSTPGGTDTLNGVDAGNALSYNIPFDLDPSTIYYATIIPFNENGQTLDCTETTFTTEVIATEAPPCTTIISPEDGAENVAITPLVSWEPVALATGYRLSIGTTPGGNDVLDNADLGNTTSTLVLDFNEGTTYYITIFPYNEAGIAQDCEQTSFSTTLGCGPYINTATGETVDLNPIITLEESYSICEVDGPLRLEHTGGGDTFTWIRITNNGAEDTFANTPVVDIDQEGSYRFIVTEELEIEAGIVECESSWDFEVFISQAPVIDNIVFQNSGFSASVQVEVTGDGEFEYALGSIDGPYQESPFFNNVSFSNIQVFVRDINGCGMDTKSIDPDPGFPKYFTPNGDGINDYWQVRGVIVDGSWIEEITVFDRFGKRIITFSPFGLGWDGTFNGNPMLDAGFWYNATTESDEVLTGFFALRRN